MEVPYDGFLNPPTTFSLEFWIQPATSPNPQMVACSYGVDANGNMMTGFAAQVLWAGPGTPQLLVRIGNNNPDPTAASNSLQVDLGDGFEHAGWRRVVVTYDITGDINGPLLEIYVNSDTGRPRPTIAPPAAPIYYHANASAPFRVGAGWSEKSEPTPTVGHFYKGSIDEVALYNIALDGPTTKKHFLSATSLSS